MSQFTRALVVSPLSDGKSWVILEDFVYYIGTENSSNYVTAVKGFVTDFTSVPRIFWWIIPRWGKYGNAAVIHDWLYWEQNKKDRKEADFILLEAMNILGVNKWKRKLIYYAVRCFGWIAWFRNSVDKERGFNRIIEAEEIKANTSSNRAGVMYTTYIYYKNKIKKV